MSTDNAGSRILQPHLPNCEGAESETDHYCTRYQFSAWEWNYFNMNVLHRIYGSDPNCVAAYDWWYNAIFEQPPTVYEFPDNGYGIWGDYHPDTGDIDLLCMSCAGPRETGVTAVHEYLHMHYGLTVTEEWVEQTAQSCVI